MEICWPKLQGGTWTLFLHGRSCRNKGGGAEGWEVTGPKAVLLITVTSHDNCENPGPLLSKEFPRMLELHGAHGWVQGHVTHRWSQLPKEHSENPSHSHSTFRPGGANTDQAEGMQAVYPDRSAFLRAELTVAIIRDVSTTCDLHWVH